MAPAASDASTPRVPVRPYLQQQCDGDRTAAAARRRSRRPASIDVFGVTRQWETFEEPMNEVIEARIYSGIHFRTADDVGARLGRQVAHFVMTHALRPPTGSWKE